MLDPTEPRIVGPDDDAAPGRRQRRRCAVLRNRNFLLLWLAQVATQIGGNMVVYGLTVLVFSATKSNSAVSLLLLTFLAPAVFFSAVAGVYVDRLDRRLILIVTNLLRAIFFALVFVASGNVAAIFILNIAISTVTTFFAPAEAAMIPELVPRRQLLAANGLFTFTQNVAFALGFALLGPLVVKAGRTRGPASSPWRSCISSRWSSSSRCRRCSPRPPGCRPGSPSTTPNGRSPRSSASCARG